jgi:ketosteroid isomerase-like protein
MGGTDAEEVRAAVSEMIDALNAGDTERLRPLLSQRTDAVHIGTDAEEWNTSKEILHDMAVGSDGDVQVVADDLNVHVQGDVAWVEGRGRFTNRSGAQRHERAALPVRSEDEKAYSRGPSVRLFAPTSTSWRIILRTFSGSSRMGL